MTGNEYQKLAMRTNDGNSLNRLADVLFIEPRNEHQRDIASLLMGCLGLAGESGELLDMFKPATSKEKKDLYEIFQSILPTQNNKYQELLN